MADCRPDIEVLADRLNDAWQELRSLPIGAERAHLLDVYLEAAAALRELGGAALGRFDGFRVDELQAIVSAFSVAGAYLEKPKEPFGHAPWAAVALEAQHALRQAARSPSDWNARVVALRTAAACRGVRSGPPTSTEEEDG